MIESSSLTKKNALVSEIMGEKSKMDMMVPQRAREPPKISEVIPISFTVNTPKEIMEAPKNRWHIQHGGTEGYSNPTMPNHRQ